MIKVRKRIHKFVVLVLIILISFNNICFSQNTIAGQEIRTKVLILAGIIDDDNKMYDGVTRAEFAKMISCASSYKDTINQIVSTAVFTDVPITSEYASYIKLCTDQGYITSYLGGLYKPNEFITYKDLIRACLALLGYTNEDFTGNQINGRYQTFCSLDMNVNIDKAKTINEYVLKIDVVNAIYNTLKTNMKSGGKTYGESVFNLSTTSDGELNATNLVKTKMEGPYLLKRGESFNLALPFDFKTANFIMNGYGTNISEINRELANNGFVIYYYNTTTKTVYIYKTGVAIDASVNVTKGYVVNIFYSATDDLTPTHVEIDNSLYYLGSSDVQFAFSYYGTLKVGDQIIFIYNVNSSSTGDDDSETYAGTITSAFLYDLNYDLY